jgi:hypothetical protein
MNSPGTHYLTHETMIAAPAGVATPKIIYKSQDGILLCYGITAPSSAEGYAPGCIFIDVNGSSTTTVLAVNVGTKASCTFTYVTIN